MSSWLHEATGIPQHRSVQHVRTRLVDHETLSKRTIRILAVLFSICFWWGLAWTAGALLN